MLFRSPFADEEVIEKLEQKLQQIKSVTSLLREGNTPEQILELLLGDMELNILDTLPTEFYCNCDKKRVEKAIISIGKKEIQEMIQEGKDIDVNCHFCNTNYHFSVEDLKQILHSAR